MSRLKQTNKQKQNSTVHSVQQRREPEKKIYGRTNKRLAGVSDQSERGTPPLGRSVLKRERSIGAVLPFKAKRDRYEPFTVSDSVTSLTRAVLSSLFSEC